MKKILIILLLLAQSAMADNFNIPTPIARPNLTQVSVKGVLVHYGADGKTVDWVTIVYELNGHRKEAHFTDRAAIGFYDLTNAERNAVVNYLGNNLNAEGVSTAP